MRCRSFANVTAVVKTCLDDAPEPKSPEEFGPEIVVVIFIAQRPVCEVKASFLVCFVDHLVRCYVVWTYTESLL